MGGTRKPTTPTAASPNSNSANIDPALKEYMDELLRPLGTDAGKASAETKGSAKPTHTTRKTAAELAIEALDNEREMSKSGMTAEYYGTATAQPPKNSWMRFFCCGAEAKEPESPSQSRTHGSKLNFNKDGFAQLAIDSPKP